MPLFLVHGFTGYLLNNEKGTIVNIINQAVTDKGRPVLV